MEPAEQVCNWREPVGAGRWQTIAGARPPRPAMTRTAIAAGVIARRGPPTINPAPDS